MHAQKEHDLIIPKDGYNKWHKRTGPFHIGTRFSDGSVDKRTPIRFTFEDQETGAWYEVLLGRFHLVTYDPPRAYSMGHVFEMQGILEAEVTEGIMFVLNQATVIYIDQNGGKLTAKNLLMQIGMYAGMTLIDGVTERTVLQIPTAANSEDTG